MTCRVELPLCQANVGSGRENCVWRRNIRSLGSSLTMVSAEVPTQHRKECEVVCLPPCLWCCGGNSSGRTDELSTVAVGASAVERKFAMMTDSDNLETV